MEIFGLLGRKLAHSYSPAIHNQLGNYPYYLFEKEQEELELFLKEGNFSGLNVTIPHKKSVLPYLDSLTDTAKMLGAVNTIVRRDGKLIGHNTDWYGFSSMVDKSGLQVCQKKVLVLGSGGASSVAVAVLNALGACPVVISRNGENNYDNLELHKDAAVIVNATPVGMYPHNGESIVDADAFPGLEGVLDLIYNPARTKLLMAAQSRNLVAENGLWMLIAQAKESAQWFLGKKLSENIVGEIYRNIRREMENIILIGMPGCGKSTVATALGHALGRPVVDTDTEIEKLAGCTIPEIFSQKGERAFRSLETFVLTRFGKESGLILATGGGCVTREENELLLRQNGRIFWLQRDTDRLPTQGRPLSQQMDPERMYRVRQPMYTKFSDHIVSNNGTVCETVENILKIWGKSYENSCD